MKYFIGIVPPEHIQLDLQKIKMDGHSEPHITVKAQSGLESDRQWFENVKQVCHNFKPFEVQLGEPNFFGEEVLFLSVKSEDIHRLHRALVKAVDPAQDLIVQYHELDNYVPHLTLAQRSYGLTLEQMKDIEAETDKAFKTYPSFEVTFVRIYCQEKKGEPYKKYMDISLNG